MSDITLELPAVSISWVLPVIYGVAFIVFATVSFKSGIAAGKLFDSEQIHEANGKVYVAAGAGLLAVAMFICMQVFTWTSYAVSLGIDP